MHSPSLLIFSVTAIYFIIVNDKFSLVENWYTVQVSDTTMSGKEQMSVSKKNNYVFFITK